MVSRTPEDPGDAVLAWCRAVRKRSAWPSAGQVTIRGHLDVITYLQQAVARLAGIPLGDGFPRGDLQSAAGCLHDAQGTVRDAVGRAQERRPSQRELMPGSSTGNAYLRAVRDAAAAAGDAIASPAWGRLGTDGREHAARALAEAVRELRGACLNECTMATSAGSAAGVPVPAVTSHMSGVMSALAAAQRHLHAMAGETAARA